MKRYLIVICTILITSTTYAAWGPKYGSGDSCIVERKDNKRQFHFCGKSQDSCADYKVRKYSLEWSHKNGESFTSEVDSDRTFFCCNKDNADRGVWKEGSKWYTKETIEKKQLTNGTCNYTKRVTICGEEESTDCTVPDTCSDGAVLRNGECVTPCSGNTAFESTTSNKCIECETTRYQRISKNSSGSNICIKCDSGTQFFDTKTQNCVSKDTFNRITKEAMEKCYGCPNNVLFKECSEFFSQPENMGSTGKRNSTYQQIITKCYIDE